MKSNSWITRASQIGVTTFVIIFSPFLVLLLFTFIAASRVNEQLSFFWENIEPVVNLIALFGYMTAVFRHVWKSYTIDESTSLLVLQELRGVRDDIRKLRRDAVGDSKPELRNLIVNLRNKGYTRISELLRAAIDNFEARRPWECIARLRLAVEATYFQALPKLGFHASETPHYGTMRKAEATLVKRGDLTPFFIKNSRLFRQVTNSAIHSAEEPDVETTRSLIDVATVLIEELLDAAEKKATRA